jgi:hypothetical protein
MEHVMSTRHRKACERTRTRKAAHAPNERTGAHARGVPHRGGSPAHAAVHTAPAVAPRMSDALAVIGLLLGTLDPSVVMQIITRAAAHGVTAILAISERAKRAAELAADEVHAAQEAHTHTVSGARSSRRRPRSSRTASTP